MRVPKFVSSLLLSLSLLLLVATAFADETNAVAPGGGDEADAVPVLVKHLPEWETAQARATYALSLPALQAAVRDQPVLDAVLFDGGAEAVAANYGQAQLAIVEYNTPQIAADRDAAITQRIAQLRAAGQSVPSAYKRVGNYSVFVFNQPDEQAATALLDQVRYEKTVRWLGDDPHAIDRANRNWIALSGSVIVNTVKATGLAIILCLSMGGLIGGFIFMRRRAQAAGSPEFSDAGGMQRLNLDELPMQDGSARSLAQLRE